jgi:glycosyltransferase involved in cell wall biosynthesis
LKTDLANSKTAPCAARRLNIVVVDEELPYPPNSGKRIRTLNLLNGLARHHNIIYLCHRNGDASEVAPAEAYFAERGIHTIVVDRAVQPKAGLRFYCRLLANLLSPLPYSVQSHTSENMQQAARQLAATNPVDLWLCEWTPYAANILRQVRQPVVVMAHNVESLIWERLWQNEANRIKRWYIKRQFAKYEFFERSVFSQVALTIAVSDKDADLARTQYAARRVAVVENGVDLDYFAPTLQPRDPYDILFLGSLDWRANLDAVVFLLDEIFPRVLASEPTAHLSIVGRRPPKWLIERVGALDYARIEPDVPDVRPYLNRCGALAVPLRVGGGSRLKILEAAACLCPVVSTPVGAEGLNFAPDVHYLQAGTADAIADALLQTIRHSNRVAEMATSARDVVVQQYGWPALSRKLNEALQGVCR